MGGRYGYHGVSTIIFAAVGCIDVVPIPPNNYDSCMRAEIRPLYRYRLAAFDRPVCLFRCHAKGDQKRITLVRFSSSPQILQYISVPSYGPLGTGGLK